MIVLAWDEGDCQEFDFSCHLLRLPIHVICPSGPHSRDTRPVCGKKLSLDVFSETQITLEVTHVFLSASGARDPLTCRDLVYSDFAAVCIGPPPLPRRAPLLLGSLPPPPQPSTTSDLIFHPGGQKMTLSCFTEVHEGRNAATVARLHSRILLP